MMYYEPNAPIDRLRWVAKTYAHEPVVAHETLVVALNTLGIYDRVGVMDVEPLRAHKGAPVSGWTTRVSMQGRLGSSFKAPVTTDYVTGLLDNLAPRLRDATEVDFIFPWVAAQLNRLTKQIRRAKTPATEEQALLAFSDVTGQLTDRGTAIAQWAKKNRVDLGHLSAEEVLAAVEDFEVDVGPVPQGPVVFDFGDGWTVQELPPEALEVEGEVMQHCVGTYCEQVRAGKTVIYSLRDPQGQPHVTMEVRKGRFQQIYGKQNQPPKDEYKARVRAFIRDKFNAEPMSMIMAGADPKSLDLRGAEFGRVDLIGVDLSGANLSGAYLGDANLGRATLAGANLTGANLTGANLDGANLSGANLTRVRLDGANLYGAKLDDADLRGANLYGASLTRASLTGADLSGADLTRATLTSASLNGAKLDGADLSGATLSGAYLSGATLYAANLSGAYLGDADLSGADLTRANLRLAYLTGANLGRATLAGADLTGANLFRADLTGARTEGTIGL